MKNSLSSRINVSKISPYEFEELIKEIALSPEINQIEENIKIYEIIQKQIKQKFNVENCDLCYLFTLFSYHILNNSKYKNYFSKLFYSYSTIYLDQNYCNKSFAVILLFFKYKNSQVVFSFKESKENFRKYFESFDNGKILEFFDDVNFGADFNENEITRRFFIVLLQTLTNFKSLPQAETFSVFYEKKSLEIRNFFSNINNNNFINNDNFFFESFYKIINKFIYKCFGIISEKHSNSNDKNKALEMIFNGLSNFIQNFLFDFYRKFSNEQNIAFLFSSITRLLTTLVQYKAFKGSKGLHNYIFKSYEFILNLVQGKPTKTVSHYLGKIENLYNLIGDIEHTNKFAYEIVNYYQKTKITTIDLVLVKVNYFKIYLGTIKDDFDYANFNENLNEIFTLFVNCIIDNSEEMDNYMGMLLYFHNLVEGQLLFSIQRKEIDFNHLCTVIDMLFNFFVKVKEKLKTATKSKLDDLFNLVKIIKGKESTDTLLLLMNSLRTDEKKMGNFYFILAFFMVKQTQFFRIKILLQQMLQTDHLHYFISFLNKCIFFILKLNIEIDIEFNVEIMDLINIFFKSKINKKIYDEISIECEQFLFINFVKLVNRTTKAFIVNGMQEEGNNVEIINKIYKVIQKIFFYNESLLKSLQGINVNLNPQSEILYYHLAILFNFFDVLRSKDQSHIVLFLKNPQVIESMVKTDSHISVIFYTLISLVKYDYDGNFIGDTTIIQKYFPFFDMLDIFGEIVISESTKKKNSKKQRAFFDTEVIMAQPIRDIIEVNAPTVDPVQSKINFIYLVETISEIMKRMLLQGEVLKRESKEKEKIFGMITKCICFLEAYNEKNKYTLLLNSMIVLSLIFDCRTMNIEISFDIDILLEMFSPKQEDNIMLKLEKITIIKLLTFYVTLVDENTQFKSKIKAAFQVERNFLTSLKKKLTIYQYIALTDINYFNFITSFVPHKEAQGEVDVPETIERGKNLLEEMVTLYKTLAQKKLKVSVGELEQTKIKIIYSFISTTQIVGNNFLSFMGYVDYEFMVCDLVCKIISVSNIMLNHVNYFGFCDIGIKFIHDLNKIPLVKYNSKFVEQLMLNLIKISRKFYTKSFISITKDDYSFSKIDDFKKWENRVMHYYLILTNKDKNIISNESASIKDIIASNKIINCKLNRYLYLYDFSNPMISKKEMYYNFKSVLSSGTNEVYDILISFFNSLYNIKQQNPISLYLSNYIDLQLKHETRLIPYIFCESFYDNIMKETTVKLIIEDLKNKMKNNLKKFSWENYAIIKHIKKIIKQLIYFASIDTEENVLESLVNFYVRSGLLNYKYNFSLKNQRLNYDSSSNLNKSYLTVFRIKDYLLFAVCFKEKFGHSKIKLNDCKEILSKISDSLFFTNSDVKKLDGGSIRRFNKELKGCFFELQKLILQSRSFKEVLKEYFNANEGFNAYIENKIKKYKDFESSEITKEDFLEELLKSELKKKQTKKIKDECIFNFSNRYYTSDSIKMNLYNEKKEEILYYIPSGEMAKLPLENFPIFFHFPIIRTSSYLFIEGSSELEKAGKGFEVQKSEIFYLLNPVNDLKDSEKNIGAFLGKYEISGIKGREPEEEEMISKLQGSKIFIYCGHGDATKYFPLSYIKKNEINFLTFLFGCSSCNTLSISGRDTIPFGLPNYYQFSKCPFLLGFLWSVTSKDIDTFMINIFEHFFKKNSTSLLSTILMSKKKIKFRYLNASALVLYANDDIKLTLI